MVHPGKGTNTVRAVFIVDPKGVLRLMMYYPQEVGRAVYEVKRALNALQVADEHKVAAPENYPNNAFLGKDMVILPPPGTEKQKADRLALLERGEAKSYDWWFSYKKLK